MTGLSRRALLRAAGMAGATGFATAAAAVASRAAATAQPIPAPRLYVVTPPTPLNVGQNRHSAFPGLTETPDGRLWLTWREGATHLEQDGDIVEAWSADGGLTYDGVTVVRHGGNGTDFRDPSPSWFDVPRITYFTGTPANRAAGAWTATPPAATAARFDGGLPYAATSAPLVRLPDGGIGGAFYARKPGEGYDTCWMMWLDGATITTNRIVNSLAAGVHHNEPVLLVDGSLVHVFYRHGMNDGIGMRTTTDSGRSQWNTPRKILANATGRPSVVRTRGGGFVMVYRERVTMNARMAWSIDRGNTWYDGGILAASTGGLGCVYAAMVPHGDREVYGVLAMEDGSTSRARLHRFHLGLVGGVVE